MEEVTNEPTKKKVKKLKITKVLKNNKGFIGIVVGVAILIVLVVLGISLLGNNKSKLEKELKEMGKNFYEEYYYDSLKNNFKNDGDGFKEYLERYTEKGFTIDLDNLSRIKVNDGKIEDFVNSKTKEACDVTSTNVVIIPKEGFGKKDYSIEVNLVCGFDKEEKEDKK